MSRPTVARESAHLPTGVVTFLFADIEGSTEPWNEAAEPSVGADVVVHEVEATGEPVSR